MLRTHLAITDGLDLKLFEGGHDLARLEQNGSMAQLYQRDFSCPG